MASGQTASRQVEEVALNEVIYWANKVRLFHSGDMVESTMRMMLRANRVSGPVPSVKYGFSLFLIDDRGVAIDMSKHVGDDNIIQVCYQILHIPTGLVSPIYDHEYRQVAPSTKGIPIDLGKVKMFPIAKVWPELAKGYSGNLPQLIQ